ncbi:hypothetical protein [Spirosoma spitsbergense]|jgi:hypothetical protein|uniref:hypothetical protein n=1 Tax=Spirosoma spitsbergense TaxID=431554 RepID=UPI00037757CC|nr:hypothetical protein [Spirosoma spitsbergense]
MKTNSKLVFILYGVIALLLLGGAFLLYKNVQFNRKFAQERSEMRATVRKNQLQNDQQQLTFGMKTFAWAVRNSLLQNKPGEINEYFNTLVKDRGIKEMLLVGDDGKVMISTNKKNQGIVFTDRFPGYLLQREEVYFDDKTPYELSAPITAPNKRLGTLVMFYNPAPMLPDTLKNE